MVELQSNREIVFRETAVKLVASYLKTLDDAFPDVGWGMTAEAARRDAEYIFDDLLEKALAEIE